MKKIKKKHKPARLFFAAVIILIVLYVSFGFSKGLYKIWRLSRIKSSEEKILESATEEKKQLELEIEKLKNDSLYIEEIAREEYGMIKDGEEVFQITLPDSSSGGGKK
ncbi:septum formation initiator family protein [Candidatus Latescibacterota bacterium]